MSYHKVGWLEQCWYAIKYAINSWVEWHDAKCWAEAVHPSWVHLATKAANKNVRAIYRHKILTMYRGID